MVDLDEWMTDNYELRLFMVEGEWCASIRVLDAGPDDCDDYPARYERTGETPEEAFREAVAFACADMDGLPAFLYHPHEYNPNARQAAIAGAQALREMNNG